MSSRREYTLAIPLAANLGVWRKRKFDQEERGARIKAKRGRQAPIDILTPAPWRNRSKARARQINPKLKMDFESFVIDQRRRTHMKPTKITTAMPFALAAGLLFTNGCADKPVDIDGATEIESALTVPVAPVINKKYCTSVIGGVCNNWQPGGNYGGSTVCDLENGPVWLGHVNFYTNPIANDMSNGGKCAKACARASTWSDDAYNFGWYNRRYSSTPTNQVNFAVRSM